MEGAVRIKPPQLASRGPARPLAFVSTLEAELAEERAAALGRLTRGFEGALAAWRDAESASRQEPGEEAARRRNRLFDAAAEALWLFVVQREACGLRNTEAVLRDHGVPAAMRLRRMGPGAAARSAHVKKA
jgi:hypothetical protein